MSEILPFSARFVPGAPNGQVSEADLAIINGTTSTAFTAADIYAFACVMATDGLTTHGTRLGASSLRNFAVDAGKGVPYLIDHDTRGGIYGYTYTAQFDAAKNEALAGVFIPVGRKPGGYTKKSSDQEIADIAAGMRREVSVGFGGALTQFVCDLCGKDVFSDECIHLPGMRFEGQLSTASVENARLLELSGVYKGSCPGAVIGKSERLFAARRFSAKEYQGWLDHAEVPNPTRFISVPREPVNPPDSGTKENKPMNLWEQMQAKLQGDTPETNPLLATALAAGVKTVEDFNALKAKADQLEQYKTKATAYDAAINKQRSEAKGMLLVLHPDKKEDREAEETIIDNLPAGAALDRYCAKIAEQHDAKLGTSANVPGQRSTVAPDADPNKIARQLTAQEQTALEAEISQHTAQWKGK